jgi:hypothetical protein
LSSFELYVTFHSCSPFFKTAKPFKKLSTAHGTLFTSHFNHILCFRASFSYILTKYKARLFLVLGNSDSDKDTTTPFPYIGSDENEKSQSKGRHMPEHALKTPRPWVPVHIREITPVWLLLEQPLYDSNQMG